MLEPGDKKRIDVMLSSDLLDAVARRYGKPIAELTNHDVRSFVLKAVREYTKSQLEYWREKDNS
ncbi:hypothetical protein LCGC14_0923730 [marine sediment metagenome]|uniref:Uncharacterized protein n=1 Tax=marine sediment metagenome TaxID=412755 RepID=A0A0F9RWK7_9ZZZZ